MERDVIAIGNINIDLTFYTREYPARDSETAADGFMASHGGSAANFAVGLSRLGVSCGIVGCVGRDVFGRMAVEELKRNGVGTEEILECEIGTGAVGIIVEGGSRTMIAWRGANGMLVEAIRQCNIGRPRHIHLSNVPREALREVVGRKGMASLSFDPGGAAGGYSPDDLDGVDYLMLNEAELEAVLKGSSSMSGLLRRLKAIVVKQGERGATLYSKGGEVYCQAFRVEVLDTTGAGDAFNAGFVSSVLMGHDLNEALRWGCGSAALKIQKKGARKGLPTIEELTNFLDGKS
ncbi:MAG: carbohydrate kinase family protein [Candidatus Methanosuratus sp.]|nr:carbohydrate kinase family protein [Candidatus Methanosuratincola sp.]